MHSRRPPKSLHTWGHSFALGGVFLTALLLSATVLGYVGKIEHTVHSQDQKSLRLVYTFEWEVANSEKFLRTNLDKAQIQDRVLLELRARIKKQIERISHDEALKLIAGSASNNCARLPSKPTAPLNRWVCKLSTLIFSAEGFI